MRKNKKKLHAITRIETIVLYLLRIYMPRLVCNVRRLLMDCCSPAPHINKLQYYTLVQLFYSLSILHYYRPIIPSIFVGMRTVSISRFNSFQSFNVSEQETDSTNWREGTNACRATTKKNTKLTQSQDAIPGRSSCNEISSRAFQHRSACKYQLKL